jgi:ankyrin repeat protein
MLTRNAAMARLLLERGANVNAKDDEGNTALMFAAANNNVEMLRLLIDAGADLNVKENRYHSSALDRALGAEHRQAVELLLAAGAADERVKATNGTAIDQSHPAFIACREYLRAIYAEDVPRLKALSTRDRPAKFEGVDWASWRNARPSDPQLVDGFTRGDDATVAVSGVGDGGFSTTWEFQLRREQNEWRILRERWVVKGLR